MMTKPNLKYLILASFTAVASYFFMSSIVYEFYIKKSTYPLQIAIKTEAPINLKIGNIYVPEVGLAEYEVADNVEVGKSVITYNIEHDLIFNTIYLQAEPRICSFKIDSIFVVNQAINYSVKGDSLLKCLSWLGSPYDEPYPFSIDESNSARITFDQQVTMLIINQSFLSPMYERMQRIPRVAGFVFAFLVLIVLMIGLVSKKARLKEDFYSYGFVGIFLLLLFIPFVSQKEIVSKENRRLSEMPSFNQLIWNIPKKFNEYYNDHFPFRNVLGELNNRIKIEYFNFSPLPNKVQIGKDGWLYLSEPPFLKTYMGDEIYSQAELNKIKGNLEEIATWLANQGIDFYFLMPPLKNDIYPEYLPVALKAHQEKNKRNQLMSFLKENSSVKMIDPFEMLTEAKDSVDIYYKTDTHWNRLGAFLTYKMLISRIQQDHPEIEIRPNSDYSITKLKPEFSGDLLGFLNVDQYFSRSPFQINPNYEYSWIEHFNLPIVDSEIGFKYYENDKSTDLRLLLFRDSFSSYLGWHLADHFQYTGMSWTRKVLPSRVASERPNIVVQEMIQGFIDELLVDNPEEIRGL